MKFFKDLETIDRVHQMIKRKSTGSPTKLAYKLNTSLSTAKRLIGAMKNMGAPINYNPNRQSYEYKYRVDFEVGFREIKTEELNDIDGGSYIKENFLSGIFSRAQIMSLPYPNLE